MKALIIVLAFLIYSGATVPGTQPDSDRERLVFEGTVLRVGPDPGYNSGGDLAVQLVKYRIKRVCEGRYEGREIIVDRVIMSKKDLTKVKVGETVCMTVMVLSAEEFRHKQIVKGMRELSDVVTTYYREEAVSRKRCPCN